MEWFIAVVAVAALGVAAMAAAGGMGQMAKHPVEDVFRQDLPGEPLTAEGIRRVRFGVALRGYAMDQVDELLDRLGREVADRDERIAALEASNLSEPVGALRQAQGSADKDQDLGSEQQAQGLERRAEGSERHTEGSDRYAEGLPRHEDSEEEHAHGLRDSAQDAVVHQSAARE